MHHVALDRPRPDDRDLDHEVVESLGLHARQHRHLRPAFDLEHADRVGLPDHRVGRADPPAGSWRDRGRCPCDSRSRSKARRMQPSMPRPSTSTFMNFRISISFLSHSMTCRFSMAAGSIGTRSSRRSCVSTKPPGCCERWRGAPISVAGEFQGQAQRGSSRLRLRSLTSLLAHALRAPAPDETGQRACHVLRHAQHLADFAHCAAGAVGNHDGGERRAMPAIGVVDPLDDLLAPLMLEIDIDIGRLVALLGDEALEQKLVLDGVDRGDAEHVADGGIRRRAAPLAEDACRDRAKFTMAWTVRKYGA